MNNLINKVFENEKAFIPFITAGDPDLATTEQLIYAMADNGADMIEVGIPFSDPVTEGIEGQKASERALSKGITTDDVMDMVEKVRKNTDVPLAFMTYINLIFNYGIEKFMKKCSKLKVSAIIVPDIPYEEKEELEPMCNEYGISLISFVASASKDRVKMIAKEAKGFAYLMPSVELKSSKKDFDKNLTKLVNTVKETKSIPCVIGFDEMTESEAREYAKYADGIVISDAVVKIVGKLGVDSINEVANYVKTMKNAINEALEATA